MNEIITYPDQRLREISQKVKLPLSEEDRKLLNEMYAFVKNPNNKALGLSAIQVGVPKRMCVIVSKYGNHKLVNPQIISHSNDKQYGSESCLSVSEDVEFNVPRWRKITVVAYDAITGKNVIINAEGFYAVILQHEIDHMNGKLYIDYVKESRSWDVYEKSSDIYDAIKRMASNDDSREK